MVAVIALLLTCCGAPDGASGSRPVRLAADAPGSDAATSPSTQPPTTSYGAPGGDASPNASTPGPGTMTGAPGGDSSPVGESPGGSPRPSNTSR